MPCSERNPNERADIILNPLGVIGRLNPSQLFEHELNFIAQELVYRHKDSSNEELFSDLMKFIKVCSPDQFAFLTENIKTEVELDSFVEDVRKNGLSIHQAPFFDNITWDGFCHLYDEFKIEKLKLKDIQNPLIMAPIYYIKLNSASSLSDV